jgi:subtilisin family serine protease
VTTVAHLLRGLLPVLAASATVAVAALPATATVSAVSPVSAARRVSVTSPVSAASPSATRAGEWWLAALHLPATLRGAPAAGAGVTVAVLSTGVEANHPDLTGRVTAGPDYSQTGRKPGGQYWGDEGTAVASLIAGHGHGPGGAAGVTGVAPGARILSVQVTLEYDDPLFADAAVTRRLPAAIAAGIRYAVSHGAAVITLPLDPGTLGPGDSAAASGSTAEQAAIRLALTHGVLLVAPAGDNGAGSNAASYPAAYPGVIAVGATSGGGELAPFTAARSYVALTAPGAGHPLASPQPAGGTAGADSGGLTVAAPDGGYQSLASTDMSAALTAGVAALIRARYRWLTVPQVTQALERGVTGPGSGAGRPSGNGQGHGELDAAAALTAAAAIAAAHPAPAPGAPSPPASALPSAAPPAPVQSLAQSAVAQPAPRPARRADPGHLLRSLVTGLAVAAGALIICLIAAITLSRLRRRRRRAGQAAARSARGASHGRHARERPAAPPATTATTAPAESAQYLGYVGSRESGPLALPVGSAGFGAPGTAETPPAPASPSQPYAPAWSAENVQRPWPDEEAPWPPARPPGYQASPDSFLSAAPDDNPDGPLPPWDLPAGGFPGARSREDIPPWPVASTGPMYVWNPNAATGPLGVLGDDGPGTAGPGPGGAGSSDAGESGNGEDDGTAA